MPTAVSLNNFAIDAHSPMGVGAHATVYWGRHRDLDQDVAIKVMSSFAASSTAASSNYIDHEKRAFDQLVASGETHPNVVDLVSQFESPGAEARKAGFFLPMEAYENPVHCFVTEFLGGGSLEDSIKHRKASGTTFTAQEVLDVALSVSEGLGFLHAQGIAHRDVKPGNLIYSVSREDLKLIDFSLAAVAPKKTMQHFPHHQHFHGNVGTKGYVAPEVLRNSSKNGGYGPTCDVFSLGCVLHEMLAGEPPSVELGNGSTRVVTNLSSGLSRATRHFVDSLLALNPASRPTAPEILALCTSLKSQWDQEGRRQKS